PAIDHDGDRAGQVFRPAAESTRLGAVAPEGKDRSSLRRELLHAAELSFRGVDVALLVEGEKVRAAGAAIDVLDAVELARLAAVFAPLAEELGFRRESLDAAIDLVGNIHASVLRNGDAARLIEVAIVLAELAPGSQ